MSSILSAPVQNSLLHSQHRNYIKPTRTRWFFLFEVTPSFSVETSFKLEDRLFILLGFLVGAINPLSVSTKKKSSNKSSVKNSSSELINSAEKNHNRKYFLDKKVIAKSSSFLLGPMINIKHTHVTTNHMVEWKN